MTHTTHGIGQLVTRIQHDFLDTPGLALTPAEAETRFRLDAPTCVTLLDFLADAGVLARIYRQGEHVFLLRHGAGPHSTGPSRRRRPQSSAGGGSVTAVGRAA